MVHLVLAKESGMNGMKLVGMNVDGYIFSFPAWTWNLDTPHSHAIATLFKQHLEQIVTHHRDN
jgi:hypothetical protein